MSYFTRKARTARAGTSYSPIIAARAGALLLMLSGSAAASTFTVNSTADTDGACSTTCTLRQAINSANSTFGFSHQIEFNITGKGPHAIAIGSPLPTLTHDHTTINGYTQAGSSANTLASGDDADIRIVLQPVAHVSTAVNGLVFCSNAIVVRGLSIVGFGDNGIQIGDATVGGTGPCGGAFAADGSIVAGNFIGLLPDGTTAGGNDTGVFVNDSGNVRIGGIALADRNVISASVHDGVNVINPDSTGTQILGNLIGTSASGTQDRGNGDTGVEVAVAAHGIIVGDPAAPNLIAFNHDGIAVIPSSSTGNTLYANDIAENDNLGIDLCGANCFSVNNNDVDDADTGANNLQNFPVLADATVAYGKLTVNGSLDIPHIGVALPITYTIALYASAACHAPGNGQGSLFLGSSDVSLVDGGVTIDESFSVILDLVPAGTIITSTATDAEGNTSEFSQCIEAAIGDGIYKNGFEL